MISFIFSLLHFLKRKKVVRLLREREGSFASTYDVNVPTCAFLYRLHRFHVGLQMGRFPFTFFSTQFYRFCKIILSFFLSKNVSFPPPTSFTKKKGCEFSDRTSVVSIEKIRFFSIVLS